jgi:hypothetical protein
MQIFKADDIKTVTVKVPEWGGEVIVKTMNATEKADFEMTINADGKNKNTHKMREMAIVATVVDKDGKLLFTPADINKLSKKSGAALDRIFDVTDKLNRILASDVETLAKN